MLSLDPAAAYDLGSPQLIGNLYQNLLTIPPGGNRPVPEAAERCWFRNARTYVCTLRSGLRFSNGDPLSAADVKHSLDRVREIGAPTGPASLLGDLDRVEATDARTVTMHLDRARGTWPHLLTRTLGAIVPRRVFPARRLLADAEVVGSGPYTLARYVPGQQAVLSRNAQFAGPAAKTETVVVNYYADGAALKGAIERGEVDIAFRGFNSAEIAQLRTQTAAGVRVLEGPGSEIHYLVFDLNNVPVNKRAVRRAIAQVVDRAALARVAYADTVTPLYSLLPAALDGATPAFLTRYGPPNVANAKASLERAGMMAPVALNLWYTPTRYGPEEAPAMREIRRQLQSSGLFKVKLRKREWVPYKEAAFARNRQPVYGLGWFADYLDGDNYLTPFIRDGGFMGNRYAKPAVNDLLDQQLASTDPRERAGIFGQVQDIIARDVPVLPLWERKQIAVVRAGVEGVQSTLDPALVMRFWLLSKQPDLSDVRSASGRCVNDADGAWSRIGCEPPTA